MNPPQTIGEQERALLHYVAERDGATVGQAVEGFGVPRSLARSTVLTMMERLRRKGYLRRRQVEGVFRYVSVAKPEELLHRAVASFVATTLDGSVSPFVTYLAAGADLSAEDLAELEQLVARLQEKRGEPES
jgi:predicted transcriptional regulator